MKFVYLKYIKLNEFNMFPTEVWFKIYDFISKQYILSFTLINWEFYGFTFKYIFNNFSIDYDFYQNFDRKSINEIKRAHGVKSIIDLPKSLTSLKFDYMFNTGFKNFILPLSLTHIEFGYCFNQPVDYLPNTITHLIFGYEFNQPIKKLPNSLIFLKFGTLFNERIQKLPEKLKRLEFGSFFDFNNIKKYPLNIKTLKIDRFQNNMIIPNSLKKLIIRDGNLMDIAKGLVSYQLTNLEHISYDGYLNTILINNLPHSVKTLKILKKSQYSYQKKKSLENIIWPKHLKCLILYVDLTRKELNLPNWISLVIKN